MTVEKWIDAVAKEIVAALDWEYQYAWNEASNEAEEWDFNTETPPQPTDAANFIIEQFKKWQASTSGSKEAHQEIKINLINIQIRENIKTLFAVESGSRAWGFPSPDSDYDVRFVYVRPRDWYLSIEPGRDVIELPLEGDMDINGWDLKKALGLLLKPNPVLLEWLTSPVKYIWNEGACSELLALAKKVTHGHACLHHYLSLGSRQWTTYVDDKDQVNLKKYLYAVRPAMAIRWLRMYPELIPPMNFYDLKQAINLTPELEELLDNLLEQKSLSKELGEAPRIKPIDEFITSEFNWAETAIKKSRPVRPDLSEEANDIFRKWVE